MNIWEFFMFAEERERIRVRREKGYDWPWTADNVLREYRFCNIFREDDTTTAWFRKNVRDPLRNSPRVLFATAAFRWFNRIETGVLIREELLEVWDEDEVREKLEGLAPIVTGAYIIKTPDGMTKLEGVLACIRWFAEACPSLVGDARPRTLEDMHTALMAAPFMGAFMAYEVVTDLRHTYLLEDAPDINTWASFGPGATRGMGRVIRDDVAAFRRTARGQKDMLANAKNLLTLSRDEQYWPRAWRRWEMREVEHTLCEFDKYERARRGEGKLKRRYARPQR